MSSTYYAAIVILILFTANIIPSFNQIAPAIPVEISDANGQPVIEPFLGKQLFIKNPFFSPDRERANYVSIMQIKDHDRFTEQISFVSLLNASQAEPLVHSWTPDKTGDFTIDLFIWTSLDKPRPIPPSVTTTLTVFPSVKIVKGAFNPAQKENYFPKVIKVVLGINNTVVWLNEDLASSSVESEDAGFDSGQLQTNQTWRYTFTREGVYGYHSVPHPWMKGAVIVLNSNSTIPKFWQEVCNEGYPQESSICGATGKPLILPPTFNMSSINLSEGQEIITLHEPFFGNRLHQGSKILFYVQSTALVNFQLFLVDRKMPDVHALANEAHQYGKLIDSATQIRSYARELDVQKTGLYIFVFKVEQPKPVATVAFEAYLL